jgi:hypothetical protein
MDEKKYIKAHFVRLMMESLDGKISWNRGKLLYKGSKEIILYHLIWFKRIYRPKSLRRSIPDNFYISPTRIYFKNSSNSLIRDHFGVGDVNP